MLQYQPQLRIKYLPDGTLLLLVDYQPDKSVTMRIRKDVLVKELTSNRKADINNWVRVPLASEFWVNP